MKKASILISSVLAGTCLLGCISMGQTGNVRKNRVLDPKLEFSAPRTKVSGPLNIVLGNKITAEAVRTLGAEPNQVHTVFTNYREALGNTIRAAFQDNFSAVTLTETETKKGFELLILHTKFGQAEDSLEYHCVLTKNGKDIFEIKSKVVHPLATMGSSIYTWQDDTANLQATVVSKNIAKLAEELNNKIFFNPKLAALGIK